MSNYIKLARQAREDNNTEDAKNFYNMARTEDPENIEARFYYAYYSVEDAINRDVPSKFRDYINVASTIVKKAKASTMSEDEKIELLELIVEDHIGLTIGTLQHIWENASNEPKIYTMNQFNGAMTCGVPSLDAVGCELSSSFGSNPKARALAAKCWKAIINNKSTSQWYYFQSAGSMASSKAKWEELVAKIKKIEPSFPDPKKPAAVSCGFK